MWKTLREDVPVFVDQDIIALNIGDSDFIPALKVAMKNRNKSYKVSRNAGNKKGSRGPFFMQLVIINYLLLMYIVTSKPKRMSLYSGVCQFILLPPIG